MEDSEEISALIGEIYDAALDRGMWPAALKRTCGYVGGVASSLLSHDSARLAGRFYFSWGDDPHFTRLYFEKYIRINPLLVPTQVSVRIGQVVSILDMIPRDEYLASRFYKEWAEPQGYIDALHGVLDKSISRYAAVAVVRHEKQGTFDDEARKRMALLVPHFRRAVAIGQVIDVDNVETAALADALDGLAAGLFLVDGFGRIVHANAAGRAILAEGRVLRDADGILAATEPSTQQLLQSAIAAAGRGDAGIGTSGIPLVEGDGTRWITYLLPLTAGARRQAGAAYSAVAAVFVRKAALELPHPLETIAGIYKLTPAELRVLMAVVEIGGVPEIAPVLGIAETTVKSHLQHVFEKTGTARQADLVKLVAGHMSPLAIPPTE
jgi:DNA-binding CsgD family transcriptional regulator